MQFFKTPHIDFMKYKFVALAFSAVVILAGILNITVGKGLKMGVDFQGGTLLRVKFAESTTIGDIRQALASIGLGESPIQAIRDIANPGVKNEFQIRTKLPEAEGAADLELEAHEKMATRVMEALRSEEGKQAAQRGLQDLNALAENALTFLLEPVIPDEAAAAAARIIEARKDAGLIRDFGQIEALGVKPEAVAKLREKTYLGSPAVLSRETVGPQVGADLRRKATLATVWALLGMLVYIAARFKIAYGVSAILTLTHDVLFTLAIFSFTSREISLPVIAAILTIVGFSINDTIVIFDRVRDNLKIMRRSPFAEILNTSINQTLSRSIITSGTVFLTVLSLFLFGGEVINDFAFVMLIGVIEGSYSTIYLSCPVVLFWQKLFKTQKTPGKK
jgi:preprotein translocase subunit SecF